jgi:hypothetical protein
MLLIPRRTRTLQAEGWRLHGSLHINAPAVGSCSGAPICYLHSPFQRPVALFNNKGCLHLHGSVCFHLTSILLTDFRFVVTHSLWHSVLPLSFDAASRSLMPPSPILQMASRQRCPESRYGPGFSSCSPSLDSVPSSLPFNTAMAPWLAH